MVRLLATTSALAVTLALAPTSFAQSTAPSSGTPPPAGAASTASKQDLNQQDKDFVKDAAIGGMAEVDLGKMAQQKAQSPDVKQFGERMVKDHSAANEKLKSIASSKSVEVPKELDAEHKQMRDKLQSLSGAQFDSQYMQGQVQAHEKTIKLFEKEGSAGKDNELKQFAQSTLPTLKDHLKMAKDISQKLSSSPVQTSQAGDAATPGTSGSSSAGGHIRDDQVRASKLIGSAVYDSRDNKIGDVNELVIDPDGKVAEVILGVGGFLGVGEKNVAVKMNEMKRGQDNKLVLDKTKDQLQQAQNFDLTHDDQNRQGASGSSSAGAPTGPGAGGSGAH